MTWHPASETPPGDGWYLVIDHSDGGTDVPPSDTPETAWWWHGWWADESCGDEADYLHITHWTPITMPGNA